MELRPTVMKSELTALLIAPDRALGQEFTEAQAGGRSFQIVSELKTYPSRQTLEIRLRQLRPDVVMIDAATNLEAAGDVIRFVAESCQPVQVVGLHRQNDPEAILTCLRLGASEFLCAPFEAATQHEAFLRLLRLRQPEPVTLSEPGTVVVYSGTKPGSGASTLAFHTAYSLHRSAGKRVLLIDLDLTSGLLGFYSKLDHPYSVLDALRGVGEAGPSEWARWPAACDGVDILPAPDSPYLGPIETADVARLFEYAREHYDYVLADAPAIFRHISLVALSNADRAVLVSTGELASVHLTRKALQLLDRLGFPKDRLQIVLNRVNRNDDVARSGLHKLFTCQVSSRLPEDAQSLHRVLTLGRALDADCDLGKGIRELAAGFTAWPASSAAAVRAK